MSWRSQLRELPRAADRIMATGSTARTQLMLGYLLLALSTGAALFLESAARLTILLALSALTALWLPLLLSVHPHRARRPGAAIVFYLGLSGLSSALLSLSSSYLMFASIGYPYAVALFASGWSIFAVATTAALMLAAQSGALLEPNSLFEPSALSSVPQYLMLIGIAAPLISAGWLFGRQSDKHKRNVRALAQSNARLATALRENAALHSQLVEHARRTGALDERERMTGEIHDTIAQGLAGTIAQLNAAERAVPDVPQMLDRIVKARTVARECLTEARRSVHALGPTSLAESQLPEAIAELADRWAADAALDVDFATEGAPRPLPTAGEIVLYRVAQESLVNIAKHAQAGGARITLSYRPDSVLLRVSDDGIGFDIDRVLADGGSADSGFGLGGMRQRARSVNGAIQLTSTPGRGTVVTATVPVEEPA